MKLSKRLGGALAIAPLLIGLSGCSEDNEKGVKKEGTTTAPEASKSTDEAIKKEPPASAGKVAPPKGYPGAPR